MSTTLFDLGDAIKAVKQKFDSQDKVAPDVFKDTLDSLQVPFNEKMDNLASWQDEDQARVDWLDKKIKQLKRLKDHYGKQKDQINAYMTDVLDNAGYKHLKTKDHMLHTRNYRKRTVIDNEAVLPKDYIEEKKINKVNKKLIYEDLRAGKKVSGAHLADNRKTVID